MTSPKLAILLRQVGRRAPEKAPASETGLGAAIEQMIDQAVEQKVAAAQQKPSAHVQRLLDQQFNKPAPVIVKQLPPAPKTPKVIESVVVQRDELGRIKKMVSKPASGDGPTFEMTVAQRDENGHIARMVMSRVDDDLPDPSTLRT
ncbi:hypothetical protein [Pseudomonas sp. NPDC086251]|uniref:hypothetical protein n=1 Tax=Pseudomonas sp. NPDC086251 TaxID=3364431 RepID=UPI0038330B10